MKTLTIDGLKVPNVSDEAEAAILKLQADMATSATALTTAQTALAAKDTEIATKDAEIATLTKAVEDAKVTPAQLRDAAKVYADTVAKAKALGVTVAEDADIDTVQKAVVDAKMGDAAKDWSADQIAASFAVLTRDAKAEDAPKNGVQSIGAPMFKADGATAVNAARAAWLADKSGAYRPAAN